MKLRWYMLGMMALVSAFFACGCGRRAQPAVKAKPAQAEQALLPEWAPKNPSPEFLRALKVLKPLPLASLREPGMSDAVNAAFAKRATMVWPAAFEFFGTLTDAQVARFLTSKGYEEHWTTTTASLPPERRRAAEEARRRWQRVLIPMKDLTPRQRRAFDNWVAASDKANAGLRFHEDYLVLLYKTGAARDLSNVRVGFVGRPDDVGVICCVTKSDGAADGVCSDFAPK